MATIREVKKELRHREWAEEIAECQSSAAVMSIIETAKRNNLDVYGYLLYLLTVLPEMGTDPTEDQIKSVMPWSFALPAYCRQTYSEIQ